MRAAEEQKAREDAAKVARAAAARAATQRDIDASRAAQLALKAQLREQAKAEAVQFVEEVRPRHACFVISTSCEQCSACYA